MRTRSARASTPSQERQASAAFEQLYRDQWWLLLRVAQGVLGDSALAEEAVQDAFAALYRKWPNPRDEDAAIGYVRVCVVNGCRTRI